jgi:hypothetical protein
MKWVDVCQVQLWLQQEQMHDMIAYQPDISTSALAIRHSVPKTTKHISLQMYSLYPY